MQLILSSVWIGQNPSGWWVSEKFDGVRAYWDGLKLWSRYENEFHPPAWWIERLPAIPLDGELWFSRGGYLRVMGEVKRNVPDEAAWRQIKFMVFDAPTCTGPFEERQDFINRLPLPPQISIVKQTRCKGPAHLRKLLRAVHVLGGEGLMLRQPGSLYEHKRSKTLLKVRCANNSELLHD